MVYELYLDLKKKEREIERERDVARDNQELWEKPKVPGGA